MPYYERPGVTLHLGDAEKTLSTLPAESVQCIVTSPPYYGLRDYGTDGQSGLESTPDAYVENLRAVFREASRVLDLRGTLWLNLGDTYANKNLLGMPWRVALALQSDGWILRNAIVWDKTNGRPDSKRDRFTVMHEYVFLLTRSQRYDFDLDAIRVPARTSDRLLMPHHRDLRREYAGDSVVTNNQRTGGGGPGVGYHLLGKNPGDVWHMATQPFAGAHFACMPPKLAERCILAGSQPGATILDPYAGSGTTGMVALRHGREFVGIDISADYLELALATRLSATSADVVTPHARVSEDSRPVPPIHRRSAP